MAQKNRTQDKKKRLKKKKAKPFSIPGGFWKKNWLPALMLVVAGVGLYSMALNYEYVLDDAIVITKNDFTKNGFDGIADIFKYDSFQGYFGEQKILLQGARYRPLSIVTFAIEHELAGGLNRQLSHLINAILYALLTLLIYRTSHIFFKRDKDRIWYKQISFWTAVLFLFHPVHIEAVANIKGRDEIMTMLGAMSALFLSFKYREKAQWYYLPAIALTFFLGLLSKENTITFLAVIPIALWYFARRGAGKIWPVLATIVGTTIVYLIIRIEAIGFLFTDQIAMSDLMNDPFKGMSGADKLATTFYTLGKYIQLQVFPHPLSHDYYPYAIPRMTWGNIWVLLSFLAYLGIALVGVRSLRKPNMFGFLAIFYLATLSIVSNLFVPVGTFMNERFIFIPSLAYCMLLPYLALYYIPKKIKKLPARYGTLALAGLGLISALFLTKSIMRIPVWENPYTLNRAAVNVSTNSARANCFLATAMYNESLAMEDREEKMATLNEALGYLNHSLDIYPTYSNSLKMKAGVSAEIYKYDNDLNKLLSVFKDVAMVKPELGYLSEYLDYLNNRGRDIQQLKDFYYDIGYQHYIQQQNNPKYGLYFLNKGLAVDPNDTRLNRAIADVYQRAGDIQRASQYLQKANQ